jgi:hypothetical protein
MSIIRRWSSSIRGKSISTTILILIIKANHAKKYKKSKETDKKKKASVAIKSDALFKRIM